MSQLKQVKASAGSGKTYQLTRRFLRLLDSATPNSHPFTCTNKPHRGYAWPEIMAVTFTNKAATEMKERVVTSLKHTALALDDQITECSPQTASNALDSILRRYHRLNIRTIDSLLALLLRLFALEFGIRPDFQMIFDEREMFDAVYDHFVHLCEIDGKKHDLLSDAMNTMIRHEGRSGFWMQDMVRRRLLNLTRFLRDQSGPLLTDQSEIKQLLTTAHSHFTQNITHAMTYFTDIGLPCNVNFKKFLTTCQEIKLFESPPRSKMIQKKSLRECVLAKGKDMVNTQGEAQYAHLKKVYSQYAADHAALTGAYFFAPAIDIAMRLLNGSNDPNDFKGLKGQQKQQGLVLGSFLAGFVNEMISLGDAVSEAYCRLGCRLHHLLIDEFQDTSKEQWKAITPLSQECLAKGGSLYYVGDVKQAIYAWRGGDSALFDEVLTQPDLAPLVQEAETDTLPHNWRSFRNIVKFNNTFFGNFESRRQTSLLADTLFPAAPDAFRADFANDLADNFTGSAQGVPPKNDRSEGYVRMALLPGGRTDEIEEQTLEALDALMEELTARRRFRDIAVLVRTHDHAALVCDLLVQKDIPVITENSLQLNRHPIIRQLTGLLGFLDYPRDDVAFLTFVSGRELFLAETGLSETDFNDWLIKPKKKPLGVCFRADYPEHWANFIEPFYNQSGLMTPYDLAREAIRTFRVLQRHPESELYVRRFLEVVHLAEDSGYGSLSAFLNYWAEKSDGEKVPLPENIDAVRIMTIHKSKGLEYPVVIVPFHNWSVRPDQEFHIATFQGNRLLSPMKKGLGTIYQASLGRAACEQLNLLYVAWTRAREELYGFFTDKPAHSPALTAMNMFLEMNDEPIHEYGVQPTNGMTSQPESKAIPPELPRQSTPGRLMEWLPRLRVYRHKREDFFYTETMRGEVAHKVMEYMHITGDDQTDTERAVQLALEDFPSLAALDRETMARLHHDLRTMTHWVLATPRLRQWLSMGEREPEVMDNNGQFKRFDLLYRGKDTVVVDFKTGHPSPKNQRQVVDYMAILDELYPETTPKGYLVYLDLQEIIEVAREA